MRVEREGGSPPMAEDLEEQLRAAREQGQLQAAQSKVKDLHRCVALQETELQQLRRSLEARLKAEDLLKAELRMSSTMHKVTQPPMHPASAPASTPAPLHPHLCTRFSLTSLPERVAGGGRPFTAAPPRRLPPIEPPFLFPSPVPMHTSSLPPPPCARRSSSVAECRPSATCCFSRRARIPSGARRCRLIRAQALIDTATRRTRCALGSRGAPDCLVPARRCRCCAQRAARAAPRWPSSTVRTSCGSRWTRRAWRTPRARPSRARSRRRSRPPRKPRRGGRRSETRSAAAGRRKS